MAAPLTPEEVVHAPELLVRSPPELPEPLRLLGELVPA